MKAMPLLFTIIEIGVSIMRNCKKTTLCLDGGTGIQEVMSDVIIGFDLKVP